MLSKERALEIMQLCLDDLHAAGMLDNKVHISPTLPLFGEGSQLDSMGFVTFVTDVEERVIAEAHKDIFIVLSDIEELYPDAPVLSASMFSDYLLSIAN